MHRSVFTRGHNGLYDTNERHNPRPDSEFRMVRAHHATEAARLQVLDHLPNFEEYSAVEVANATCSRVKPSKGSCHVLRGGSASYREA